MADDVLLLDESIRRRLDRLQLVPKQVRAGSIKGERRSKKRGTSIEFADYRNYSPGDDLRRLDWNVYARLERPYIKLLEDEEDLAVHVLLDASASMEYPEAGNEDEKKSIYARRLFSALGYIGLSTNDRVMMTAINDHGMESFGPSRGRGQTIGMLRYVHGIEARGITDLNQALHDYTLRVNRPGMAFVISDMFSPSGYIEGLNALVGRGYEVVLIHVLAREEVEPTITGDLRLIDSESGNGQEVSMDSYMRDLYTKRVEAWQAEIRSECNRRNIQYVSAITDYAWEKVILFELRRLGVVK